MSRYAVDYLDDVDVVVGWDDPLQTFFGIVESHRPEDDDQPVLHWVGKRPSEIQTVEELGERMAAFVAIPEETAEKLREDQRNTEPGPPNFFP